MGKMLPDCKRCACNICGYTGICHCPLADPKCKTKVLVASNCDNFTPIDDDVIFCLIGPSGSGKTTIAKMLEKDGYNIIHSYTTRKPRKRNEWGHKFAKDFTPNGEVIAHNVYNGNHYWAEKGQYEGRGKSVYIIDPPGFEQLKEAVDVKVVGIFMTAPPVTLIERMSDEGRECIEERINHDVKMFAAVQTDWAVDAKRGINEVYADINSILGRY